MKNQNIQNGQNPNRQNQGGMNQAQNMNGMNAAPMQPMPNPYYQTQNTMQNPYYQMQSSGYNSPGFSSQSGGGINTTQLLTGALIGAAAAYLLTNEKVQKSLFKGFASVSDLITGGLDELKERFEDAKAEYEAEKAQ